MAASPPFPEKPGSIDLNAPPTPVPSTPSYLSTIIPGMSLLNRFGKWREQLDLPNPGTVENLQKEVKATHLAPYTFDGARADLTKSLSMNPLFQVTHSFALGSQTAAPSYTFGAMFANQSIFMHGNVDHDGNVNARLNQGWSVDNITKVQGQFSSQPGHNSIQIDHDYTARDYSVNLKCINPWPADLTGIVVGNYLQSLTKNIAIGFESFYQRVTPGMADHSTSYLAKFTGTEKNWIATAQVQPAGIVQATYWQKLSEKVEVAADLQVIVAPARRDAVAVLGAKYDFRMATFRAQVDSTGKVSALLEQRFAPTFAFLVAGEIDHFKNAAKVGVGVMIESSSLTPEEMGMMPPP